MAEDTNEHLGSSDCSSAFTYDEIIDILRSKQQYFEAKWKRANSDSADMLMGMSAACGFLISDFASRASDKQKKRLAQKGLSMEQTHCSDDSLRPGPQGRV
jgi:hypothetical protein